MSESQQQTIWPFPAIVNVEMVPLHESINPNIRLTEDWPKMWVSTDIEANERRCSLCRVWKDADEFYHDETDMALKRMRHCKDCHNAQRRAA